MHFTLAHILLDETLQFVQAPLLFYRGTMGLRQGNQGSCVLPGGSSTDFTTYFNALSSAKWHLYTNAGPLFLHLELRGGVCTYLQRSAGIQDYASSVVSGTERDVSASNEWQTLDIPLVESPQDVLLGFSLDCAGAVEIRNAFYYTEVSEDVLNEVELALSTTTFKKEAYITRNIEKIRSSILGSAEEIAKHFHMYVIDNGRTLAKDELEGPGISVIPNRNVGGSGGFARGMIAALEGTPAATHVILMDDDVTIQPESIYRTYALLRLEKDGYKDAFISGAMMGARDLDIRFEDLGCVDVKGFLRPLRASMRMNTVHNLVESECYAPDKSDDEHPIYAGWWYCCIPSATIRAAGLPLPFFVRFDDVEYGLRCKPYIISMNGISIWHDDFSRRYNATVDRYQITRNSFAGQAMSHVAPHINFMQELDHNFRLEIAKLNYTDATLVLEAFEDFLRGPQLFMERDFAEDSFMAANKRKEKLLPYEEIAGQVKSEFGVDIYSCDDDSMESEASISELAHSRADGLFRRGLYKESYNGAIRFQLKPFGKSFVVLRSAGWDNAPGLFYGVDTVIALDVPNRKGIIRRRDNNRAKELIDRYEKDLKTYRSKRTDLEKEYAESFSTLSSKSFWDPYLGL